MSGCERANSAESTSALDGQYQGLVLDFGGVLTTSFDGTLRSYCVRDGLAPDALEKIFTLDQGAQGALVDLARGRISQAQFVSHIAAALGVDPDGLLERMLADLRWEPLVVEAVAQLRSRGIKVAVLSNGWGAHRSIPTRASGSATVTTWSSSSTRSGCANRELKRTFGSHLGIGRERR